MQYLNYGTVNLTTDKSLIPSRISAKVGLVRVLNPKSDYKVKLDFEQETRHCSQ